MRKHPYLRALALAAVLAAPLTQAALANTVADQATQQAMSQNAAADPAVGQTGPYDASAPTVGD